MIVAAGPMVPKALAAADILKEQKIEVTVLNNPFVNRPDVQKIGPLLQQNQNRLITVEDHQLIAGAGAILAHALLLQGHQFKMNSIGHRGEFGRSAYKADHLYDLKGMAAQDIARACQSVLSKSI